VIDAENASSALLLAERGEEVDAAACYLRGGARLDAGAFASVAHERPERARATLARLFAATPLAEALRSGAVGAFEDAVVAWHQLCLARQRLIEPLGAAPVLWLAIRRQEEVRRVRRAAWRLALGGTP
jgi:hypothetical protein